MAFSISIKVIGLRFIELTFKCFHSTLYNDIVPQAFWRTIQETEYFCIGNGVQSKNKNTINFITGCLLLLAAIKCKGIKSSCITFLYHESLILYLPELRIVGMIFLFKGDATRTTHYNKTEEFIAVAYNIRKLFLQFLGASPAAAWVSYYNFFFSTGFLLSFTNFYRILFAFL